MKYSTETIEALKGSIQKWQNIVDGTGEDLGTKNCPLCQLYWEDSCSGCPVFDKTQYNYCYTTPYWDYCMGDPESGRPELEFLQSLLTEIEDSSDE